MVIDIGYRSETPKDLRITEWPGLKRTTVIIESQPPAMGRVTNHQTRLPRRCPALALPSSEVVCSDYPLAFVTA